jgi:hypothetical protein
MVLQFLVTGWKYLEYITSTRIMHINDDNWQSPNEIE